MRDKIRHLLAVFCYYAGIDALMYCLNRGAKRIVTFHNVLPDDICQQVPHIGVSCSLSEFSKVMQELKCHFRFSTDVMDPSTITITFDDGTYNEYAVAGKYLISQGIPAILFLTGDMVGATGISMPLIEQVCVWSELVPVDVARGAFGDFSDRVELWQRYVQPGFRADAENRGTKFLAYLNSIYSVQKILDGLPAEWNRLRMSGVNKDDVDDLKAHGWSIGWHTKTHFPLGFLSVDERIKELTSPMDMRSLVLGYPYGDIVSVGKETPDIARKLGYPCAVSNTSYYSPYYGQYFMQRMALDSNKYELHLVLSGAKYFLQCRKLLPLIQG